jgi:hypothetical protein
MKIIKRLTICALFICLISCINTECINLFFEKNETFWIDAYKKGDTIVFSSNQKNNDTIFILNKTIYKPNGNCNPIEVSNYDCESCVIDYKFKHDTITSESDYFIQHVKEANEFSIPTFRVYGLEYSKPELKDTIIKLNTIKKELTDCFTFNKKDCYVGWSKYKIKTFVWSKKMGLVMFVGENGEKFEFLKKN